MAPENRLFLLGPLALVAMGASLPLPKAAAQAIDTNRPGFSFTTGVVAPGQWQLETGFDWVRENDDSKSISLPQAELRYGVSSDVELFVSGLGWSDNDGGGSGFLDPSFGAKVAFGDPESRTQMALLFEISVPIGSSDFSSDRWDPTLAFIWSHAGSIPLAGTAQISKVGSDYLFDNGIKVPFAISDSQSAFVEWEANIPESGGSTHWLNGAYQLLLEQHIQLDASAGIGLNSRAGDFRLGVGFAYRF